MKYTVGFPMVKENGDRVYRLEEYDTLKDATLRASTVIDSKILKEIAVDFVEVEMKVDDDSTLGKDNRTSKKK